LKFPHLDLDERKHTICSHYRFKGKIVTDQTSLAIGEVSRTSGCKIETIRYYERIGLLSPPPRTAGRHRLYSQDHVKRLVFIRRGRNLGFSLDEIRSLLGLTGEGAPSCERVREITLAHAHDIRQKIDDLERMDRALRQLAEQCEDGEAMDCPVIDALFAAEDNRTAPARNGP
jgi:MerR family transcriptional regulator, mercuric resistance operon regulatory protein